MFNRVEFKKNAKNVIKKNYWICFLATLIVGMFSGCVNIAKDFLTSSSNSLFFKLHLFENVELTLERMVKVNAELAIGLIIIAILLITFLVLNVFRIGIAKFFIETRNDNYNIRNLLFGFKKENYIKNVMALCLRSIYIFFWTLILVIPGIVATYRYRFVPYILADNPNIKVREAMNKSMALTNGIKMDLFILDLSFIGWHLLGLVTFNISEYFLAPYFSATDAEIYNAYKKVLK